jgi:hypothetical protein
MAQCSRWFSFPNYLVPDYGNGRDNAAPQVAYGKLHESVRYRKTKPVMFHCNLNGQWPAHRLLALDNWCTVFFSMSCDKNTVFQVISSSNDAIATDRGGKAYLSGKTIASCVVESF